MIEHRIGEHLTAVISDQGAELQSIRSPGGAELLWQGGPPWPRRAPVLFPIVGRLVRDTLIHDGLSYPMPQHGFARDRPFRFITRSRNACRLMLDDDATSRAIYPFAFQLEIEYRIEADTLTVSTILSNPSPVTLPASLGVHPAFAWPLLPGLAQEAHELLFDCPEPGPIRRLEEGLLRPTPDISPIEDRRLSLAPALFAADALILEAPASRALRYGVANGPALRIAWTGFSLLGLWSKAGGAFLCIEPWSGLASPLGFDGEFRAKPHVMLIPPGDSFHASWSMTLEHIT